MEIRDRFSKKSSHSLDFKGQVSLTKGSFRDECDVNKIMARYQRTGQLPGLAASNPQYADVSTMPETYLEAVAIAEQAEASFLALPAAVRKECDNSPAVFLERVKDPRWAREHHLCLPPSVGGFDATKGQPDPSNGVGLTQPGASASGSCGSVPSK